MSEFDDFLKQKLEEVDQDLDLPCCHTTSSFDFASILNDQKLRPAQCKNFHTSLLYFFYGRPSYRLRPKEKDMKLLEYLPVCFVIHPEKLAIDRAAAFDTGAWEMIKEHVPIHDQYARDSFILENPFSIQKLIKFFFGDNEKYFEGKSILHREDELFPDFVAMTYQRIITSSAGEIDNRSKTIELHLAEEIPLKPSPLQALILPELFLSNAHYKAKIDEIISMESTLLIPYNPTDLPVNSWHGYINHVFFTHFRKTI